MIMIYYFMRLEVQRVQTSNPAQHILEVKDEDDFLELNRSSQFQFSRILTNL